MTRGTCPRCEKERWLSDARRNGVEFYAALCAPCRDETVRETLMASFERLMGRLDAAERNQ